MKAKLFFSLAGALALAACGDTDTEATDETLAEDTLATPTETATPAMTAQAFADAVAASDMYEVEAGRLAQDMGTSEEVRDFGAMMVEDHTTSTARLRAAAAEVTGVTVNPQMTSVQQSNLEALQLLRDYAVNGDSAPLRTFAGDTATAVEGHLASARELP